ncbi:Dolichyldiphosphatase 1 [Paragonimus heterotremus]|uniref:Dolichyldiphosphatase 1 n=1 Tax=Paragonimus heterotremus TaxID=100268 RepID=A0A8J4TIJ1_9TREM|nr:Dolichyldiphosphatase 1 [Paragonimus heterotremus]
MDSGSHWISLDFFNVMYPKGDITGKALAYFSTTPIIIVVGLITLTVFRRDLHTVFLLLGVILNELLNTVVKKTLRQPRPVAPHNSNLSTYGMPSSHAQFVGFFCLYIVFFIRFRLNEKFCRPKIRLFFYIASVVTGVLTCYSRLYLLYHTTEQIVVGLMMGLFLALGWFPFVHSVLSPFFPRICNLFVGRVLMLQDFTSIPNVFLFEYTNSLNWNRRNQRT